MMTYLNYDYERNIVWIDWEYVENKKVEFYLHGVLYEYTLELKDEYPCVVPNSSSKETVGISSPKQSAIIALQYLRESNYNPEIEKHIKLALDWLS